MAKGGDLCKQDPSNPEPWYGVNAVALRKGCKCPDSHMGGACATDERVPRAFLNASMLPTVWPTYVPIF